ncbi:hypothetical protein L1887_36512 [Cichorium endivia]|nr:hypothetical protein L1887_36512 [Cichorium endivia]
MIRKHVSNSSPVTVKLVFYELTLNVMMLRIAGKRRQEEDDDRRAAWHWWSDNATGNNKKMAKLPTVDDGFHTRDDNEGTGDNSPIVPTMVVGRL